MISLKFLWIILPFITASYAFEVCYERSSYSSSIKSIYCSDSCCGSTYNRYCCTSYSSTGVYTGSGFGSLALIAVIVTCICCCRRSRTQGRLMTTNQLAVISTGTVNTTTVNQGYNYPAQPPIYYPQPTAMAQPPPSYSTVMAGQPSSPMAGPQYPPMPLPPYSPTAATAAPLQNGPPDSKSSAPPPDEHAYTPLA
ncbi:protein shisa-5-like [Haliotis rufescens]|uniref:protein shisa-5-like n=1 Tax=Haliotis rufescens TaxID=6454 RepID=UPI00201E8B8E|nr:protein shisa-5-like [Haliotis rufescens]